VSAALDTSYGTRQAVRPEFRVEPLVFAIDDVVFGGTACLIAGCPRSARGHGVCQGYHGRWQRAGRPDVVEFVATADPRWKRKRPNGVRRAAACGFGIARRGLCPQRWRRWERTGRHDLTTWLASPPPIDAPAFGAVCRIVHCDLWPQGTCRSATATPRPGRCTDEAMSMRSRAPSIPSPSQRMSPSCGCRKCHQGRSGGRCSRAGAPGDRQREARRGCGATGPWGRGGWASCSCTCAESLAECMSGSSGRA